MVSACGGPPGPTPDPSGQLAITHVYEQPPPGQPISIGGYATLLKIQTPDGSFVDSLELSTEDAAILPLEPGDYELLVTVRSASDAITVDQNGRVHRPLGPVSARCDATVRITAGDRTNVGVTTVGGDACRVTSDGG